MQPDFERSAAAMVAGTEKAIAAAVAPLLKRIEALEGMPAPERGEKGDCGDAGAPGRDGVGLAGALIDRSGVLVLTLTDGTTRELGVVVGKDGADGSDGADGKAGLDGEKGADGRDGFSLEDFDVRVLEDDRTIEFKFASGQHEHVATMKWPTVIDRGVYKAGEEYDAGDAVSWGGSLWIAQRETSEKPDSPDSGFRLAVKRGRDGKDAK